MPTRSPDPYAAPDRRAGSGRASVPNPSAGESRISGRASLPQEAPSQPSYSSASASRGGSYGRTPEPARVGKPRRRWRKILLTASLTVLILVGLLLGGGYLYARNLDSNMGRTEVFSLMSGERPAPMGSGAMTVLMLGSDSRDPDGSSGDVYRADTIMLMHVPPGRDQAFLISIPRDLWVYIPTSPNGAAGNHEAKINAATAFGGVPLAVMTVENYTGLRIDHVMMIDFGGFVEVTDALDGVEMEIEQTITSIHGERRVFEEGTQHLNGEEALDYVRQRYQFADGDFTRMRNQQQFLKALMDKAASSGTLSNPGKLNAFLQTATQTLTVDEEFSLVDVGWSFRNLRGDNLTFLTSPHNGTGSAGGESVVFSDDAGAAELYTAVREDRLAQWIADHPDAVRD